MERRKNCRGKLYAIGQCASRETLEICVFVKLMHSYENFLRDIVYLALPSYNLTNVTKVVDVIATSEILFVTITLLFALKDVFSLLFAWRKLIVSHGWQIYICHSSVHRIKL